MCHFMSRAVGVLALIVCSMSASAAEGSGALDRMVSVNIEAQPLATALIEFSKQASVQVITPAAIVKDLTTQGVRGDMRIARALGALLQGTKLGFHAAGDNTIGLDSAAPASTPTSAADESTNIRLAQAPAVDRDQSYSSAPEQRQQLEEVIVTAQKRDERLQDVPVPVTTISAELLADRNQLRLEDYYTKLPALSLTTADPFGGAMIAIRGITTGGYGNPTVGIVVDDVPYTSSSGSAYGYVASEIDPSELANVEVLRGPQGTLYGASSMGGLLKYVTIDPSTEGVSGRIQVGYSSVRNADDAGLSARGSINIPVSETLAVRASGFSRRDPGYIDDPAHDEEGVNLVKASGGRLTALWLPSDEFSVKVGALLEHSTADGSALVEAGTGLSHPQQSTPDGWGGYRKTLQVYNANLRARLGQAELTAISAYIENKNTDLMDFTAPFAFFAPLTEQFFGVTVAGTASPATANIRKFTQEVRLSWPLAESVDLLLGGFYTHENTLGVQEILATDFDTGATAGRWWHIDSTVQLEEYAAFADLTFQITDRFDVQVGGRGSQNRQSYESFDTGPYNIVFGRAEPTIIPQTRSKDSSFTYLVTPRLRMSPNLMAYARLASGYRPGGPNPGSDTFGLPGEYGPDKTQNIEVGVKGDAFEHALTFDASAYYINWQDIQLQLFDPVTQQGYFANGGEAKSSGIELSMEARPLNGLTLGAWVAWNDAVLTEDFPVASTAFGVDGDRLPTSARVSGSFSLEQEFSLWAGAAGFLGGSIGYVGERHGPFSQSSERQIFPSYTKVDLHGGIRYESWVINLYINNLTDEHALLTGGVGAFYPTAFTIIQPRTAGLSVSKAF